MALSYNIGSNTTPIFKDPTTLSQIRILSIQSPSNYDVPPIADKDAFVVLKDVLDITTQYPSFDPNQSVGTQFITLQQFRDFINQSSTDRQVYLQGTTASAGPRGLQGVQGIQGISGTRGLQGLAGESGSALSKYPLKSMITIPVVDEPYIFIVDRDFRTGRVTRIIKRGDLYIKGEIYSSQFSIS